MLKRFVNWMLYKAGIIREEAVTVSTIPSEAQLDGDGLLLIGCDDMELLEKQIAGRIPGITDEDWW